MREPHDSERLTRIHGHMDSVDTSKPYVIVEHAGRWDVMPEGTAYGMCGSEMEEDVDLHVNNGWWREWEDGRERERERERERKQVQERICLPKMRKWWKDAACPAAKSLCSGRGNVDVEGEVDVDGRVLWWCP
ncbi:hypothetical protein B0H14DRAFT_3538671 [Mycena olivaceomarginata]|nr:hypothetical protein B0H14DRAFT_3538671 [Mycena olivaceomarginata]